MEGSTAVARTSTPMPPSQWVKERQNSTPLGIDSMSVRMEAPVVVKPEADSNTQSTKEGKLPLSQKGRAPNRQVANQIRPTATKPSRVKKWGLVFNRHSPWPTQSRSRAVRRKGRGLSP